MSNTLTLSLVVDVYSQEELKTMEGGLQVIWSG